MKKTALIALFISFILLLPMLFFPISNDLAIYMMAGRTIAGGGRLYVDFIDVKAPIFYDIHALSYLLFGFKEISPRLFDFIWQFLSVLSLYYVTARNTGKNAYAASGAIVYSLYYVTLNYTQTFHPESLAGLPLIWLIHLQLSGDQSNLRQILKGLLIGFIISLKYPMGIVLIGVLIYDFMNLSLSREFFKRFLLIIAGMIISLVVCFIQLFDSGVLAGFSNVMLHLSRYSGFTGSGLQKETYQAVLLFFTDNFSLLLSLGVLFAIIYSISGRNRECIDNNTKYIFILTFQSLLLFISIIVERKFNIYFFSRIGLPLSVLAGCGLFNIYMYIRSNKAKMYQGHKLLIYIFALILLVYSPLPRWARAGISSLYFFTNRTAYDSLYQIDGDNIHMRLEHKEISGILARNMVWPNEKVFMMSNGGSTIYVLGGLTGHGRFAMPNQYFNRNPVGEWKSLLYSDINDSKWLVIQKNDSHPSIMGNNLTSWQALHKDTNLYEFVNKRFDKFQETSSFYVYRKK